MAVFDNDGTLWCEKPMPIELGFILQRLAAGKIFCLVEAANAEAANTVHREAYGLVADEIYPVTEHT